MGRGEEDGGSIFVRGQGWSPKEVAEGAGRAVWRSCCLAECEKSATGAICDCSVYHVGRAKKAEGVQGALLS